MKMNSSTKEIDVLVTFYNQEDYVDQTIQSIISQKVNADLRIIIGDDGSNDQTIKKIVEWEKKKPGIISHYVMERNPNEKYISGFRASANRLKLLNYVTGDYFIFLDGDDYFSNINKLQNQLEILEDHENDDCVAAAHNIEALYDDGKKKQLVSKSVAEGKYSLEDYWAKLYFHTDTLLIRSSIIKLFPRRVSINHFNDNFITFLILQNGKIYYTPSPDAVYRQTSNGIWTGSKVVINNIRNMFLFDLCNNINSKVKIQTMQRFYDSWKNLFKHRSEITTNEMEAFKQEAIEKNLTYSILWTNYPSLSILKKTKLMVKFAIIYIIHKLKG